MEKMIGEGWSDISTAPKDGKAILVGHEDAGTFLMAWNPIATNPVFAPGVVGMWEAVDGSFTWRNDQDGPSHWKPIQ